MTEKLTDFVEALRTAYGEHLVSVVLYGSRASGEETGKKSDYNLLVVVGDVYLDDLRAAQAAVGKWVRAGNPAPLLFTLDELRKSADVFPIEFMDIKDNHRILAGEDPFRDVRIHGTHLRHECEFELRGQLLKLYQGYMTSKGKPARVRELLTGSVSSFLAVFRNVLRLGGAVPPVKKIDALPILAGQVGMDARPFLSAFAMKAGDRDALSLDPESVFTAYIEGIEKVLDFVDKHDAAAELTV